MIKITTNIKGYTFEEDFKRAFKPKGTFIVAPNNKKRSPNRTTTGSSIKTNKTNAQIASFLVKGTKHIPKRDFISVFGKRLKNNDKILKDSMLDILSFKTRQSKIAKINKFLTSQMKLAIKTGQYAKLAKSTVKQKGSSRPLLWSGQLVNSIKSFFIRG